MVYAVEVMAYIHLTAVFCILVVGIYPAFYITLPVVYAPVRHAAAAKFIHTTGKYFIARLNYDMVYYLVEKSNLSYFPFLWPCTFVYNGCPWYMRLVGLLFQDIVEKVGVMVYLL